MGRMMSMTGARAWVLLRDGKIRGLFRFKDEAVFEMRRVRPGSKHKWAVKRAFLVVKDWP